MSTVENTSNYLIVNSSWKNYAAGKKVTYKGVQYEIGVDAFATETEAQAKATTTNQIVLVSKKASSPTSKGELKSIATDAYLATLTEKTGYSKGTFSAHATGTATYSADAKYTGGAVLNGFAKVTIKGKNAQTYNVDGGNISVSGTETSNETKSSGSYSLSGSASGSAEVAGQSGKVLTAAFGTVNENGNTSVVSNVETELENIASDIKVRLDEVFTGLPAAAFSLTGKESNYSKITASNSKVYGAVGGSVSTSGTRVSTVSASSSTTSETLRYSQNISGTVKLTDTEAVNTVVDGNTVTSLQRYSSYDVVGTAKNVGASVTAKICGVNNTVSSGSASVKGTTTDKKDGSYDTLAENYSGKTYAAGKMTTKDAAVGTITGVASMDVKNLKKGTQTLTATAAKATESGRYSYSGYGTETTHSESRSTTSTDANGGSKFTLSGTAETTTTGYVASINQISGYNTVKLDDDYAKDETHRLAVGSVDFTRTDSTRESMTEKRTEDKTLTRTESRTQTDTANGSLTVSGNIDLTGISDAKTVKVSGDTVTQKDKSVDHLTRIGGTLDGALNEKRTHSFSQTVKETTSDLGDYLATGRYSDTYTKTAVATLTADKANIAGGANFTDFKSVTLSLDDADNLEAGTFTFAGANNQTETESGSRSYYKDELTTDQTTYNTWQPANDAGVDTDFFNYDAKVASYSKSYTDKVTGVASLKINNNKTNTTAITLNIQDYANVNLNNVKATASALTGFENGTDTWKLSYSKNAKSSSESFSRNKSTASVGTLTLTNTDLTFSGAVKTNLNDFATVTLKNSSIHGATVGNELTASKYTEKQSYSASTKYDGTYVTYRSGKLTKTTTTVGNGSFSATFSGRYVEDSTTKQRTANVAFDGTLNGYAKINLNNAQVGAATVTDQTVKEVTKETAQNGEVLRTLDGTTTTAAIGYYSQTASNGVKLSLTATPTTYDQYYSAGAITGYKVVTLKNVDATGAINANASIVDTDRVTLGVDTAAVIQSRTVVTTTELGDSVTISADSSNNKNAAVNAAITGYKTVDLDYVTLNGNIDGNAGITTDAYTLDDTTLVKTVVDKATGKLTVDNATIAGGVSINHMASATLKNVTLVGSLTFTQFDGVTVTKNTAATAATTTTDTAVSHDWVAAGKLTIEKTTAAANDIDVNGYETVEAAFTNAAALNFDSVNKAQEEGAAETYALGGEKLKLTTVAGTAKKIDGFKSIELIDTSIGASGINATADNAGTVRTDLTDVKVSMTNKTQTKIWFAGRIQHVADVTLKYDTTHAIDNGGTVGGAANDNDINAIGNETKVTLDADSVTFNFSDTGMLNLDSDDTVYLEKSLTLDQGNVKITNAASIQADWFSGLKGDTGNAATLDFKSNNVKLTFTLDTTSTLDAQGIADALDTDAFGKIKIDVNNINIVKA